MRVGDTVDDFTALDQYGSEHHLVDLAAPGPLVQFFYPKAMTPG